MEILPYGESYWLDEAHKECGEPAILVHSARADFVIVGGGYSGLWTAIQIKKKAPDKSVLLVEKSRIGAGPSGMNGGFVSGYQGHRSAFTRSFGVDVATQIVDAGDIAQAQIIEFLESHDAIEETWFTTLPNLLMAMSDHQLAELRRSNGEKVKDATSLATGGFGLHQVRGLVEQTDGSTVHPTRLLLVLKRVAQELGVQVFENSGVISVRSGTESATIRTARARVDADVVVLATGPDGVRSREGRSRLTILSAYAFVTEPMPAALERAGWGRGQGGFDVRTFIHWMRSTNDDRMVVGSTAGPIANGGRWNRILRDRRTIDRAIAEFREMYPEFAEAEVEKVWAGPIDMASDQLPFFGRRRGGRVVYGHGLSGHGVNAAWIAGQCLSSLALGRNDEWTASPFCSRRAAWLPPEPLRSIAGTVIKKATLRVEDAQAGDRAPAVVDRIIASVPRLLGMKIGVRD